MNFLCDYIQSLSEVTLFCSLRNVLSTESFRLVTKVSCPQQCVTSACNTELIPPKFDVGDQLLKYMHK